MLKGKHISTGSRITADNSPDFSRGTRVEVSSEDVGQIKEEALRQTIRFRIATAAVALLFLFMAAVSIVIGGSWRDSVSYILFGAVLGAFHVSSLPFKKAVDNGEITLYRFTVQDKESHHARHGKRYYVSYAGTVSVVDKKVYSEISAGSDVYCAVFSLVGKDYFCCIGNRG